MGWLQPAMAILGGLALLAAVTIGQAVRPDWLLRFALGWCVLVPYWWYVEYRLFVPSEPEARARFLQLQAYSEKVWMGGLAAVALLLWWRAGGP